MILEHSRIFRDESRIKIKIPFTEGMKEFFKDGDFPLTADPLKTRETTIIGMFILRPAHDIWSEPPVRANGSLSIYDVVHWIYNIDGLSGGGVIANGNVMDGYRLAMQYAISDAVIIGSSTIINDGVPKKDGSPGYLWLPQHCAEWPHLKTADPGMMDRFREQRKLMQQLGYASQREYPAQIAVTRSGNKTKSDLLSASIFHEKLPDDSPIEAYIVTSKTGAGKIRERAADYNLEHRIDDILIPLSPDQYPNEIDLPRLPGLLFRDYNIILANHDGGKKVLEAFCKAGIINQFNFTFGRNPSLYDAVKQNPDIDAITKNKILQDFPSCIKDFFDTDSGRMPDNFFVAEIITDEPCEAAVVVLDTRKIRSFKEQ
ncbi:MAG: hypothetical protein HQ557_16555 [Bacteroidetes bacterium]|nr:hypothetical protein [Bacteroidota bacterium]